MKKPEWFIRRPHAIERMREYGSFPQDMDSIALEAMLRGALDEAAKDRNKNFHKGCKPDEFAVRIAIPDRNVFYAVVRHSNGKKVYDYVVPTVLTVDMFQQWTDTGKLGSIEELTPSKREMPKLKPQLCLRWANGDGKDHWGDYCADDVPDQIRQLIGKGVDRNSIKVYKEIPFKLDVKLEGFTA